jgi:hypothetical protein
MMIAPFLPKERGKIISSVRKALNIKDFGSPRL